MDLDGSTILLTGGNRGIGLALAERLAREPVRLLVGVRDLERYEPIAQDGALEVSPVQMDLGSRDAIDESVALLGDELDRLDVLINNAGGFLAGQLERQDLDDIYATVQSSLLGTIHLTRCVLPGMLARGRGKIVNNTSVVGYLHMAGLSTYSAAKAGAAGFTECLRRELAETPVTTLHVVTGSIDTDMLDAGKDVLDANYPATDDWDQGGPKEWADKIAAAILDDTEVLGPGGRAALGKLASHLPSFVLDTFSRQVFDRT